MDWTLQNKLPQCKVLCGSKMINQLEVGLESHRTIWISWQPWWWSWISPARFCSYLMAECTDCLSYWLTRPMLWEKFPWGINHCDLHTMVDGLLLVIGNGPGTVPLHVLMTRAEPTSELGETGFENEVQDILGCWTRCAKISYPIVGFVWSWLCKK